MEDIMSNEIKTYQRYDFSVEARSLEEAVKKTTLRI